MQLHFAVIAFLALASSSNAFQAAIFLRNGSSINVTGSITSTLVDDDALSAVQFSVAEGAGIYERADYASAYINNETLALEGGVNPLDSFATVEANNSYLLLNTTGLKYQALELLLVENNTLGVEGANLGLNSSTIRLIKDNWFLVNSSILDLANSKINFTDYFTWLLRDSSLSATQSVVSLDNVISYWDRATVDLVNVTLDQTASGATVPARYEGKISPVVWIDGSNINTASTQWTIRDMPLVHIGNTALALNASDIFIYNSNVHFFGSNFNLTNANIHAYNSSLYFFGNTTGPLVTGFQVLNPQDALGNLTEVVTGPVSEKFGTVDFALNPGVDVEVRFY